MHLICPTASLCGIGVELEQTQHVKVTNNDISYVFEGILVVRRAHAVSSDATALPSGATRGAPP